MDKSICNGDHLPVDCKTVGFYFSKSVKKSVKRAVRVLRRACEAREKNRVSPQVSLSVFSLVPDLLFNYSRVLEYAKIRTVLHSNLPANQSLPTIAQYPTEPAASEET